ncbi:carboxylate--amine ligase [Fusibacter bizertensis]
MMKDFLPVILGTDSNAYGMAKAFHMAYGIKSLVVGKGELFTTSGSQILNLKIVEALGDASKFADVLNEIAVELKKEYKNLILIASSDGYVELIVHYKKQLEDNYIVPFIDEALMLTLNSKEGFYKICEAQGLNYPKTKVINKSQLDNMAEIISALDWGYPVVLKPSDSMRYFEAQFDGKQKAYICDCAENLLEAVHSIYNSTYDAPLILQEYISGDDSSMRVLNCLSGPDGKVRLMCLGQPLLEDPTPTLVGNYTAIIDAFDRDIFAEYKSFLEGIGYVGFSNFDMKYDVKTGKYKVFEINLRQGRSSFFVTGSGYNQGAYLIDAFVYQTNYETEYADKPHLWLGIPKRVLMTYLEKSNLKHEVNKRIDNNQVSTTLYYAADKNLMRNLRVFRYYGRYNKTFKKYFVKKQ